MDNIEKMVVIGCSAGGLEACRYLVPRLRLGSSSLIIVSHIFADRILEELTDDEASVPSYIRNGLEIEPGKVYIKKSSSFEGFDFQNGRFVDCKTKDQDPINDAFTRTANAYQKRCIGVVLSGAGGDGAIGSQRIKKVGGKVFVQRENYILAYSRNCGIYCDQMPMATEGAVAVDFSGNIDCLVDRLNLELNDGRREKKSK